MGIFSKIKNFIGYKLNKLFKGGVLNDEFYDELESILLLADMGALTVEEILDELKDVIDKKRIRSTDGVKDELREIMLDVLDIELPEEKFPLVIMLIGVNGVGKTTAAGKLAYRYKKQGKSVTIAAADTFRAAASDQLSVWAKRADVRLIKHAEGADPGAVVYDAIASAKTKGTDVLIIDTAGRLHNKKNLMDELGKISRIIEREYASATHLNYIVLDATTGQNAVNQVEVFDEICQIDGIIVTKMDGTAKGGMVFSINNKFDIPVIYAGMGESIEDITEFDVEEFVSAILS